MQISTRKIGRYIQIFLYVLIAASAAGIFLFLAAYFYPAITGSQATLVLQKNMAAETINISNFNSIITNIDTKAAPPAETETINNPFK